MPRTGIHGTGVRIQNICMFAQTAMLNLNVALTPWSARDHSERTASNTIPASLTIPLFAARLDMIKLHPFPSDVAALCGLDLSPFPSLTGNIPWSKDEAEGYCKQAEKSVHLMTERVYAVLAMDCEVRYPGLQGGDLNGNLQQFKRLAILPL